MFNAISFEKNSRTLLLDHPTTPTTRTRFLQVLPRSRKTPELSAALTDDFIISQLDWLKCVRSFRALGDFMTRVQRLKVSSGLLPVVNYAKERKSPCLPLISWIFKPEHTSNLSEMSRSFSHYPHCPTSVGQFAVLSPLFLQLSQREAVRNMPRAQHYSSSVD